MRIILELTLVTADPSSIIDHIAKTLPKNVGKSGGTSDFYE